MARESIVVTGVTGTVGGQVAKGLLAQGVPFTALVRDREKAASLAAAGVELIDGDFGQPSSLDAAFAGAERVLLVAPLVAELDQLEANATDAAQRAGIRHIVKVSTAGVAQQATAGERLPRQYPLHRKSEKRLERSGLAFTHLRSGPFMQNTLNFAPSIRAEGVFRGAWGTGTLAYIDVRDVAEVAVEVLRNGSPKGALELTGPEALSGADVAARLAAALGRPVEYVDVPPAVVRQAMLARGMPEWFAGAMVEVMQHTAAGTSTNVTQTVLNVTGKPARPYEDFAREHAAVFAAA